MPKSKRDLSREHLPRLADALAKDEEFRFIVDSFSPDRTQRLNAISVNVKLKPIYYSIPILSLLLK